MADSDLYQLELLSLVAKITQEIDNHSGINDKTLAEFVISLHEEVSSLQAFKDKLKEVGADFPESFVENVDRLILSMHPKHKKKFGANGSAKSSDNGTVLTEHEKKKRILPGLALPDKEVPAPVPDDVLLAEIGDIVSGKKSHPRPSFEDDRSPKRQRREHSPSPPRGRSTYRSNGRTAFDDRPILFKIYSGRVSGVKEFGAFVTLEGVAGRVEGECYVPFSRIHAHVL